MSRGIIAAVLVPLVLLACTPDADGEHHHAAEPASPPSRASIYQLGSVWTDQHGAERRLGELAGRVVVLAMVYTHCEAACPRIIADMRRIRSDLGDADIQLVLVSIDPERDDVARLRAFGAETGLTEQGWWLLRGSPEDVRELAAVFGFQYRRVEDTEFAHSNLINVLDRNGEITHQQSGLGVDPAPTVSAVREALRDTGEG